MSRTRVLCVLFVIVAAIAGASCKKRNECMPEIKQQPGNHTINKGESVTLKIVADTPDAKAVAYKWYWIDPSGSSVLMPDSGSSITVKPEKTTTYFAWIYTQCEGEKRGQLITDSAVVTVK